MTPAVQRAAAFAAHHFSRLRDAARRHPVRAALALPALVLAWLLVLLPLTPGTGDLRRAKSEVPAKVMSADGVLLAEYKRINRQWVPLKKISPHVVDALIATEDHRFYQHHGIDVRRTAAAVLSTMKGERQGGSTITQQLARNLYPDEIGRAPTINRKAKEAITALKIEAVYTKDEILETYLNTVPFLYNAFGIEMAARTYFDKSADRLDVLESATLIGMLKGTSAYNPVTNPDRAFDRRNLVLAQMARHGKLEAGRLEALQKRPLRVDFERQVEPLGPAPHVAQFVRRWLIEWADREGYNIYADGLVVRTTIQSRLQRAANQAVGRQLVQLQALADAQRRRGQERSELQAGFLALDPRNGHVKAWVGSRDFATEPFDHVSQARRQPGSTFKPFVYAAAFVQGFSPASHLHRPAGVVRQRQRSLDAHRCGAAQRPGDQPARRVGVLEEHHHGATDAAGRAGQGRPTGARHGGAPEQARPGAFAGPGHQPRHAEGDGRGLRHHRQRGQLHRARAGGAGGRPARQDPARHRPDAARCRPCRARTR